MYNVKIALLIETLQNLPSEVDIREDAEWDYDWSVWSGNIELGTINMEGAEAGLFSAFPDSLLVPEETPPGRNAEGPASGGTRFQSLRPGRWIEKLRQLPADATLHPDYEVPDCMAVYEGKLYLGDLHVSGQAYGTFEPKTDPAKNYEE